MNRPKQQRGKRPRPQPAKGKGRERGKAASKRSRLPTWILFAAPSLVVVLVFAIVAALNLPGGGGSGQSTAQSFPIQGTQHIREGESHPQYNSNPPTSGWHYEREASWGVHESEIPDEQAVHNLEHGGIWITYQPTLDQAAVEKLKGLTRQYRSKVLLTPRANNDVRIALAAWGKLDTMDSFDEARILSFVRSFVNQGPEKVPD